MLNQYLLSVLMTCYNREKYIAEAIESVLNSTYKTLELIIVDDGSIDNTVKIAKFYAIKDRRIRIFVNEKNLGDYPNRNKAASYARGEFMMYVDSDDKILPDGFAQCIQAMQKFPYASFGMQLHGKQGTPFYLAASEAIHRHFFQHPCLMIGPGGTILRRSFFEKIGEYPVKYGPANDMYFNLKAVAQDGIVFLPFEFNFYRIHEGQELNNKYSYLYNGYCYLKDALYELVLPLTASEKELVAKKNKRRFLVNLIKYLIQSKDIRKTLKARSIAGFGWRDAFQAIFH